MYELKQGLKLASKVIGKSPIPILGCFALDGNGEKIKITGNDLSCSIEVFAKYEGSAVNCCVEAARLLPAVERMDHPVIAMNNGNVVVKSGKMRATIPTLPYDQYPFPEIKKDLQMAAMDIVGVIKKVGFAAATTDVRYYLNGVFVNIEDGELTACASNGHRLAIFKTPYEDAEYEGKIIPILGVKAISAIPSTSFCLDNPIVFKGDSVTATAQPIDGKYPIFTRVLKPADSSIIIDRQAIKASLEAANGVCAAPGVKLFWGNGVLHISSNTGEDVSFTNEIDCEHDSDSQITLNLQYLLDAVSTLTEERIEIGFPDDFTQIIIQEGGLTHIIMPLL